MSPLHPLVSELWRALQIEQWAEHHYPSFVLLSGGQPSLDARDARVRVVTAEKKLIEQRAAAARAEIDAGAGPVQDLSTRELLAYVAGAFALVLVLGLICVWVVLRLVG